MRFAIHFNKLQKFCMCKRCKNLIKKLNRKKTNYLLSSCMTICAELYIVDVHDYVCGIIYCKFAWLFVRNNILSNKMTICAELYIVNLHDYLCGIIYCIVNVNDYLCAIIYCQIRWQFVRNYILSNSMTICAELCIVKLHDYLCVIDNSPSISYDHL